MRMDMAPRGGHRGFKRLLHGDVQARDSGSDYSTVLPACRGSFAVTQPRSSRSVSIGIGNFGERADFSPSRSRRQCLEHRTIRNLITGALTGGTRKYAFDSA